MNFLLKLSDFKSDFKLTLGYLNPALNNPAHDSLHFVFGSCACKVKQPSPAQPSPAQPSPSNPIPTPSIGVRAGDKRVLISHTAKPPQECHLSPVLCCKTDQCLYWDPPPLGAKPAFLWPTQWACLQGHSCWPNSPQGICHSNACLKPLPPGQTFW